MSRIRFLPLLLLLCAGCSSSGDLPVERPAVRGMQIGDVSMVITNGGSIPVGYLIEIRNVADIPIALRTVELRIVGGAPYTIRQRERFYPRTIAPDETVEIKVDALLNSPGGGRNADREPVTIRAMLSFGSERGSFRTHKVFRAEQ